MTYVAAEPEEVVMWTDRKGHFHPSREEAIDANFRFDLTEAVALSKQKVPSMAGVSARSVAETIRRVMRDYPDMVRVLLGDREAT